MKSLCLLTVLLLFGITFAMADDITAVDNLFVVMGQNGTAIARFMTQASQCPNIILDGRAVRMHQRVAPMVIAQRPTHSSVADSKPSDFPVLTCEYKIPANIHAASVNGQNFPLPRHNIRRIVVIGDTGCRLNDAEHAWQDCNNSQQYPFARVAAQAAQWKPDLVVHVGDYLYRENPCPKDHLGCMGSPWGYGADAWQADFFGPARPLLRAAPWVVVRGNHESCSRAGQGWWRFLDPHAYKLGRDCNVPADDHIGNFSDAYAVPLGKQAQIIVLDTSNTSFNPLPKLDFRAVAYRKLARQMQKLAQQADVNIIANHQPVLGFAAEPIDGKIVMLPGNQGLQSTWKVNNPRLFPENVDMLLSGHVHVWEQIGFSNDYPSQFVAGFSGTQEDIVPMPKFLPANISPAQGAKVAHFSSWINGFGYMTLERLGKARWQVEVWDQNGRRVNVCQITGKQSQCELPQIEEQLSQQTLH